MMKVYYIWRIQSNR